MARNGSGTYSLYTPGNPVVTGTTISSTAFNNTMNDIATALTQSIAVDGQTPITANIPLNSHKLTGVSAATTSGDALVYGQSSAALASLAITGTFSVGGGASIVKMDVGTYTPTLTNTTNITSSSGIASQYMRVGNVVTVSGAFNVTPTGAGTCNIKVSLPIASTFATTNQAAGSAMTFGGTPTVGALCAASSPGQFQVEWTAPSGSAAVFFFQATYLIV